MDLNKWYLMKELKILRYDRVDDRKRYEITHNHMKTLNLNKMHTFLEDKTHKTLA